MQGRVEVRLDEVDVLQELRQPLERVVLALDRDEDLLRRDEGIDGEQAKAGRAVDDDVVEAGLPSLLAAGGQPSQGAAHPGLSGDEGDELDLGPRQVDRRGHAPEVGDIRTRLHDICDGRALDEHVVDARHLGVMLDVERRARVALRVGVDEQHVQAVLRQRGREVDGRRRLADPTLLVRHGDDTRRIRPREGLRGKSGPGRLVRSHRREHRRVVSGLVTDLGLGLLIDGSRLAVGPSFGAFA